MLISRSFNNSNQFVWRDGSKPLTANWDLGGFLLRDSPTPLLPGDLVNKAYADSLVGGSSTIVLNCDPGVSVLDPVYLSSSDLVSISGAASILTSPCIGLVVSKPLSTSAVIQFWGLLSGFVGLIPGATYYLSSTPGLITATPPSSSGNIIQVLGLAVDTTTLMLQITRHYTIY